MNLFYQSISPDSMFDYEKVYAHRASLLPENANIAEIGVANGRSTIFLASLLQSLGKSFTLYGIDNCAYGGNNQRSDIIQNISKSGVKNIEFIEMSSLEAACHFKDDFFHFVFIDSSHEYEQTKAEIRIWYQKVLPKWYLAGHDYFTAEEPGVRQAVDEVIPRKWLKIETTLRGAGIWQIRKYKNRKLK